MSDEVDNRIEIELLKKDVKSMTDLLTKFDIALEKIQEIAAYLSKMVTIQEKRIEVQEQATKEIQQTLETRRMEHNSEIKELHSRITTVNREFTEKIEKTEKAILDEIHELRREIGQEKDTISNRVKSIEMWKWVVTGAVAFAAWLFAKIMNFDNIFG